MPAFKSRALVLKRMNIGETDRIFTLYGRQQGKIRAVARGVRKVTSRKSGHLEPFMVSDLVLAEGKSIDVITDSAPVENFASLRKSLFKTSLAYYVAELTDGSTADEEKDAGLFDLIVFTLKAIDSAKRISSGALIVRGFEVKLMNYLGFSPSIEKCANCGEKIGSGPGFFGVGANGLLCPLCRSGKYNILRVSADAVKVVKFLREADYARIVRLRLRSGLLIEIEGVLKHSIRKVVEKDLNSSKFFEEVKRMQEA